MGAWSRFLQRLFLGREIPGLTPPKSISGWIKLTVKCDDLVVTSSVETVEISDGTSRVEMLDGLSGRSRPPVEVVRTYIVYDFVSDGKSYKLQSSPVYKEPTTLKFILASREAVNIYYNPQDVTDCVFDLLFLEGR